MKNTVHTIAEYIEQGFTPKEAPLVQESDILFNKIEDGEADSLDRIRYFALVKFLDL